MKECGNFYNPTTDFANVKLQTVLNPNWRGWVTSQFVKKDAEEIISAVLEGKFDQTFKIALKTNDVSESTFDTNDDSTEDVYSAVPSDMSVKGFYHSQYNGTGNITTSFNKMMRDFTHRIMSTLVYDLENKQIVDVNEYVDGTDRLNLSLVDYKIELIESLREITHSDIDHLDLSDSDDLTKAINQILYDYKNLQFSPEASAKYNDYVILSNFNKILNERFDWISVKPEYQNTTIHSRDMYEYHDSKVQHRTSFENDKDENGKSIEGYTSSYMKRLLEFIPEVAEDGTDLSGLNIGFAGFSRIVTLIQDWALNSPDAPIKVHKELLKGSDADFDYIISEYLDKGLKTNYSTILLGKIRGIKKYILGKHVPKDIKNLFIGQMNKMVSCRYIAYTKERDPKTGRRKVVRKDLRDRVSDLQSLRLRGTMRAVVYNNQENPDFFDETFKDRISVDKNGIITLTGNIYGNGNTSLTLTPTYDEETDTVIYSSANGTHLVDDQYTIDLIKDLLQIDIPAESVPDLKSLVREQSLMDIFGQTIAITIGASKDVSRTRFKYINDDWELDTSKYGNFVSNAAQCLALLYGSETLNVLKDLSGNALPVFQLGSLFYDVKKIINDIADQRDGVYYGNNFVQNPKLLGEICVRNDYDDKGSVTKSKTMSEGDLTYLSAMQDFYYNLKDPKSGNILLQPTCFADKVRFAMFEVRTSLHKIGNNKVSDLLATVADTFGTKESINRGKTIITKNLEREQAKDSIIGEMARVRQDKIKRQMVEVISRLSKILEITIPVSYNSSFVQIQNAINRIHSEFKRRDLKSPKDLRKIQKAVNMRRASRGLEKISLCETYDVVSGKEYLEINEVLVNNVKLYWDWGNNPSTQIAFRQRIDGQLMAFAKILHKTRFNLNANHDAGLLTYFETLKNDSESEASHWINSVSGKMKAYRLFEKGTRNEIIPDEANLDAYFDISKYDVELNPVLESYALADMLYSNQINDILFGDVSSYPNKVKDKQMLLDEQITQYGEANRLVTMHKRTMVGGSTRHKMLFMPFGASRKLNIATFDDINEAMWNLTGTLASDKTQDGCGMSSPHMTILENWSYLDGAVGPNRKTIFGYTDPKTGVFTEIKWACFDISNEVRRMSPANPAYSAEVMFQRMHSKTIGDSAKTLDFDRFWNKDSQYSEIEGYTTRKISSDEDIYWWDDNTDTHWKLISVKNNGDGTVTRKIQEVSENGIPIGEIIEEQPMQFNTIADLDRIFGGAFNESLSNGKLKWADNNIKIVANMICEMGWKDKFVHYCVNESAIKVGAWNINDSDSFAHGKFGELDTFQIDCSYGGVQMDASHLAEDGEVTEMMQTVASLIQNGYRADMVKDIYQTIGEIALDAMSDIIDAREVSDERAIYEVLGKAFIKSLTSSEKDSLGLAQAFVTIAEQELLNKNIKFTMPFSAATVKPKFMSVVTSLTNKSGIRRKYAGLGTVQAPSYGIMQSYDFGNKQTDYKGAIRHMRAMGIQDPKRALVDQNYALETGLLRKLNFASDIQIEDTLVIKPKGYVGTDVGYRVQIKSIQQYDFYKNLLWTSGAYEVYKWDGQPKDLRASDTTLVVDLGGIQQEISLYDTDFVRASFYIEDLMDKKGKRNMKSSDLNNVGGLTQIKLNEFKLAFIKKVLENTVTLEEIAETIDPETQESPLDVSAGIKLENLPYILEYLKGKIQDFNTNVSQVYNNKKLFVEIPTQSVFGTITAIPKVVKVNYRAPEIMMANSYKKILGIEDGDNIDDITPNYFRNKLNGALNLPLESDLDPNMYDAMLVTSDGEKVFVSFGGQDLSLNTDDSYQVIDGKVWHKGEKVCSAEGKTFGQYLSEDGEKYHFVIVDDMDRLRELINSKYFNNIRYNYTLSNWQTILKNVYSDYFEDDQIINPIPLYAADRTRFSISRLDLDPETTVQQLRTNEIVQSEIRLDQLAQKRYDAFIETLNFIGARIPTQSMQSFSGARVVRFIDAETNEVYLPRIVAWLEGSDYDIDKWYLMGLSLLQDGSIATFSDLSDIFSYKETFKLPIPANRKFQQYVQNTIDSEVKVSSFKRQDPETTEVYNVTAYSIDDRDTSIEVSKRNNNWYVEIVGKNWNKETLRRLYNALSIDVSNETEMVVLHGTNLDEYGFTKTKQGFVKPHESELYTVTTDDIANIKLGNVEPLNKILRLSHSILKFDLTIESEDIHTLLLYLNMHERSKRSTYEKTEALKNKVFFGMQDVVSDPITQINLHTPIAMTDPQAAAANSTLGNEEKTFTSDNPGVKFKMQLQNMAGKEVTGIGAVSLKSFFSATYFFNQMASSIGRDIIDLKERRRLGIDTSQLEQNIYEKINWIVFDSKLGTRELRSLTNIYWKPIVDLLDDSTELITISELHENKAATHLDKYISGNVLDLNNVIKQLDRTSKLNNGADLISAIVSSATDNAKELILAKINATSKFADIYTLLLNTGMPFKEIAEFMMSPIFNVVNDFITPNMFDSRTKFLKVEDVIKFVLNESSILVNTNTFDNVILHADEGLSDNTSFIMKLIYETNEKGEIISPKKVRENSPLKELIGEQSISDFLSDYRTRLKARFDPKTRSIYTELRNEIFNILEESELAQAILLKHIENQITVKKTVERNSRNNPEFDLSEISQSIPDEVVEDEEGNSRMQLKDYKDVTSAEMRQLYDYVEDYLIPKMRKLKGIKMSIAQNLNDQIEKGEIVIERGKFQETVEAQYFQQKLRLSQLLEVLPACEEQQFLGRMLGVNKGLRTDDFEEYKWIRSFEVFVNKRLQKTDIDEPFDFLLFVSDEEYRKKFIDAYESVKAIYNPLRIVSVAQHFSSMLKLVETNRYLLERSAAVKLERQLAKEILSHKHEKSGNVIEKADTKTLNQKEFARLKTYVTDVITLNWFFNLDDLRIDIPEGKVSYKNGKQITTSRKLKLNNLDNLASFKHFMDSFVIPKLKQHYRDNKFLSGLIPDHRTDFRSGKPIFFYKPMIEMLNVDGTLKTTELYEGMLEGFNELCYTEISEILGIETKWTFGDLFFIYDLITNKNGYGNESFARFFEDIAKFGNGNTLVNKFYQYVSDLDNGKIEFSELQYDLDDLRNRLADLPGATEKFGASLEKDGNVATQTNLGLISVYGSVNWIDQIPVQQYPSDYTFDINRGDNKRSPIQTSKHDAFKVSGLTEKISVTPATPAVMEAAISRIRSLFGSKINIPIQTITTKDLEKMYKSKNGEITFNDEQDFDMTKSSNAFIHNGIIYINTDYNVVDGPLHEILHVICAAMKIHPKYKNKYYEWMETLRKEHKDLIKSFEANYPNKKGSDLKEEVFIHMIGESFRTKFNDLWGPSREMMRAEITSAVIDVFNQIFLTEIDLDTNGHNLGSTDLGYMLRIANTKLFNPENAYITRTAVPVSQMLATLKNKLIIEYGDEC